MPAQPARSCCSDAGRPPAVRAPRPTTSSTRASPGPSATTTSSPRRASACPSRRCPASATARSTSSSSTRSTAASRAARTSPTSRCTPARRASSRGSTPRPRSCSASTSGSSPAGSGNLNQAFYDAGTYLRVSVRAQPGAAQRDAFALTFFPFDTDRFRLGLPLGPLLGRQRRLPAPRGPRAGREALPRLGGSPLWAGFKTAGIVVPLEVVTSSRDIEIVRVEETQYAGLAGLGLRAGDIFRFDPRAAGSQQGRFDFPGVRGQQVYIFGGSARACTRQGLRTTQSLDMMLYRNDPTAPFVAFAPETYTPGAVQWNVSAEGTASRRTSRTSTTPGAPPSSRASRARSRAASRPGTSASASRGSTATCLPAAQRAELHPLPDASPATRWCSPSSSSRRRSTTRLARST
jgi:hypothetical protein